MSAIDHLKHIIRTNGPIQTARISAAQAKGNAKNYLYWDAVRYELRIAKAGHVSNAPLERASSMRRSLRLAQQDLASLCEAESRIQVQDIGRISEAEAQWITAKLDPTAARKRVERKARSAPTPQLSVADLKRKYRDIVESFARKVGLTY